MKEDLKMSDELDILTYEDWSNGEVINRFEYLEVEPVMNLLSRYDKLKQERDEAVNDLSQCESDLKDEFNKHEDCQCNLEGAIELLETQSSVLLSLSNESTLPAIKIMELTKDYFKLKKFLSKLKDSE